ncbi:hypothetical protein DFH94DRAFT_664262 [Russula ochroleuca]|uniref:Uncharacterized protein n=1 Tax=Russula ochroleuca TaxID=152965 RepID=A0A9P5N181_9AGAM|nr:hypothetical protein DFH94DRAFT_664262 [Russula ochroleuca]
MQQRALFLRRAAFARCRLFSSVPVLLHRQPHPTIPTRLTSSSQTLLRSVSSTSTSTSTSTHSSSVSPNLATASLSTVTAASASATHSQTPSKDATTEVIYVGPLTQTFRRLKIFSLSSLALASTLSPFIFVIESCLPSTARAALATTALATSGASTALVAWCGRPYQQPTHSHNENVPAGIELTTLTLTLSPLTTRVYDPVFLNDTTRAFARWELARSVQLPPEDAVGVRPGAEETVAETLDGSGNVLGRWIVTWGENGEGACRAEGRVET